MKTIRAIIIAFLCSTIHLPAQEAKENWILQNSETGNKTYVARDAITLKPGFTYTASSGNSFHAKIDPALLFPPAENTYKNPNGEITANPMQGGVVGTIAGTFNVTPWGAATYTVPVECPVGINGMQPNIFLTYNSQGGNGIAGWGWNIGGVSAITRTGNTFYHDGSVSTVTLTNSDKIILDGQRLILISGNHFTDGAKYRTEIETYSDITCKTINGYLGFEVITKEGTKLLYGASSDSYIEAQGSSTPLLWLLYKITDTNGNYMTYNYDEINTNGEYRLTGIIYTGNDETAIAPVNSIIFEYENRSDVETYYTAGKKTMQTKRLHAIYSKTNNQTYRKYTLEYEMNGNYSKITALKEETEDGIAYNPTIIQWKEEYDDYSKCSEEYWGYLSENITSRPIFADFNGDGKRDFITVTNKVVRLFLNYGYYGEPHFLKKCEFTVYGDDYKGIMPADMNGDGLMDLISITYAPNGTYRYNYHFFNGESFSNGGGSGYKGFNTTAQDNDYIIGDFNGDGKHEILIKSTQAVYDVNGNIIASGGIGNWGSENISSFPNNLFLLDITGNGKTNVCTQNGNTGYIYELNNGSFQLIFTTPYMSNLYHSYPGDYNADGKIDLFVLTSNTAGNYQYESYILFSTGVSFVKKNLAPTPIGTNWFKGFTGDFNTDGKTDLAFARIKTNGKFEFITGINQENGFDYTTCTSDYSYNSSMTGNEFYCLDFADYDGDGRSEINYNRYSDLWFIRSLNDPFFPHIKSIANGLNENHEITYEPLSSGSVYSSTTESNVSFPVIKSLPPIHLVSSHWNNSQSYNYFYRNIRIHKQGKGFLGFGEVQLYDYNNNRRTTTNYSYHPSYYNVFPVKETVTTNQYNNADTISVTAFTGSLTTLGGKRVFPYISAQTSTDYLNSLSSSITFGIDGYGNPTNTTSTNGNITETRNIHYAQKGSWCPNKVDSMTITRQQGNETYTRISTYQYDNRGNLTKKTVDPNDENRLITEYKNINSFGHPQTIETTTNGITRTSSQTFTSSGRFVTTKTNVLGETTVFDWNESKGILNSETDPWQHTTQYTYDSFGRLRETLYPDGTRKAQALQWAGYENIPVWAKYYTFTQISGQAPVYTWFDNYGREVCNQTYGLNNQRISVYTEYDYSTGRKNRVSEPKFDTGNKIWAETYTNDIYGRLSSIITPYDTTSYIYNGLTTTITTPEGSHTTTLNASGQIQSETVNGRTVNYTYYASGLPHTNTPQDGLPVTMEYNLQGNRTKLTDPDAGTVETKYNGFGELVEEKQKIHDANIWITTTNSYAPTTGLLQSIVRNGETTIYTYDNGLGHSGRIQSIEQSGQHRQSFTYDDLGRIINVKEEIDGRTYNRGTEYDIMGRVKKETYPSGYYKLNHYDSNGLFYKITDRNGRHIWEAQTENTRGQLVYEKKGSKVTFHSYYNTGRPAYVQASGIMDNWYQFDEKKGNLTYRDDYVLSDASLETFDYDDMNRLTNWNIQGGSSVSYGLSYDAQGNIQTKSDLGDLTMNYGENGKPHALTSISGAPEDFPANSLSVAYADFKKIKTLTEGDKLYQITYGVDDQRRKSIYKENNALKETRYYIGDYEEKINNATGLVQKIHYLPGAIYIEDSSGTNNFYYAYADILGSLTALVNENGTVAERYAYDPWGRRRNPDNWSLPDTRTSFLVNRGYTMHEHLDAFGIINMNGRVYDPLTAQFFSPDPFVQNLSNWLNYNRYTYCLNNPLIYVDETGEFITWSIGKRGFSIGLNFGFFGFGINVGWSDGGSVGVYGELGPRVGGTGFGSGATVSQSLDFGFRSGSFSTTTSAGAYASFGMFNAGGNVSYTHGKNGGWNWGVSGGTNLFGNDEWGLGLNVGYGSGGWDFGIGGYYNPNAWKDNPVYEPDKWNEADKVDYNNCYSYALDDIDNGNFHGLQPGDAGGYPITSYSDINLDYVLQASISDGRVKQPNLWNKLGFGKNGYYEVYLVIDQGKDYHWYRQDKGGNWSHKPGRTPVINVDASRRFITNPVRANHNYGFVNYNNGAKKLWVRRR